MSEFWNGLSKADRIKVRKEMLAQAEALFVGAFASKKQLRASARIVVDAAIAKERHGNSEDSSAKILAN